MQVCYEPSQYFTSTILAYFVFVGDKLISFVNIQLQLCWQSVSAATFADHVDPLQGLIPYIDFASGHLTEKIVINEVYQFVFCSIVFGLCDMNRIYLLLCGFHQKMFRIVSKFVFC